MRRVANVLLPVMSQDPSVVAESGGAIWPVQPVVAKARNGFWAGPTCDRVAVVDRLAPSDAPAPTVELSAGGSHYRDVGLYDTPTPATALGGRAPWVRGATVPIQEIDQREGGVGFIKVSAFGTVLRAITFVEDPVVLGRSVRWAFGDGPILVVADAGLLGNAFYDRASRSLQFFSYDRPDSPRRYYTALSQDIVTHETGHALVDGIAPDLYDAGSPQSLALHESVADVTAVMISLRSRDPGKHRPAAGVALHAAMTSSRYSRVAEELGRSRGEADSLRDADNDRTLDARVRAPARVVDRLSPHSLSQVLTGAVFSVLKRTLTGVLGPLSEGQPNPQIRIDPTSTGHDPFRIAALYAANRVGSLIYKGMDWLPPGEATIADAVRAMLAADDFHHSDLPDERIALTEECARRRIATRAQLRTGVRLSPAARRITVDQQKLLDDPEAVLRFVSDNREGLGMPARPFRFGARASVLRRDPLLQPRHVAEVVSLDPADPAPVGHDRAVIVKVAWWEHQPVELPGVGAKNCDYKTGMSIVVDSRGRLRALLRATADARFLADRQDHIRQLIARSTVVSPHDASDGDETRRHVYADLTERDVQLAGVFRALHAAGDDE